MTDLFLAKELPIWPAIIIIIQDIIIFVENRSEKLLICDNDKIIAKKLRQN